MTLFLQSAGNPDSLLNKFCFAASFGYSVPVDKFANYELYDKNYGYNYAGRPLNGIAFKIETSYSLAKWLQLSCNYIHTSNQVDTPTKKDLFPDYPGGLGGSSAIDDYTYNTNKWNTNNFSLGLGLPLNIKRVKIVIKIFSGIQIATSPETNINGSGHSWNNSGQITYYTFSIAQPAMTSRNFMFGEGLEIQYNLKHFGITSCIDLLNSSATFVNGQNKYNKNITFATLTLGLTYKINKKGSR